jgi:transcriptional regulator with XRE-family HTH domain
MDGDYEEMVGSRLRAIRNQLGMTLRDVEDRSDGKWKAVVVGSYERADRSVSLPRLHQLADFYGVDVAELLPGGLSQGTDEPPPLVINLQGLRSASADATLWPLVRFVADVRARRGDGTSDRLTLRSADARALAILLDVPTDDIEEVLRDKGLLVEGARSDATGPDLRVVREDRDGSDDEPG